MKRTLSRALPVAVGVLFICIAVAYGCLKLYDEPVRAWLSKRVLRRMEQQAVTSVGA